MRRRNTLVLIALVMALVTWACKPTNKPNGGNEVPNDSTPGVIDDTLPVMPVSLVQQMIADTATITVIQVPVKIYIEPRDLSFDALGDTVQFSATVRDRRNNVIPMMPVRFRSTNPNVITIDPVTGVAVVVGNGEAKVIAEYLYDHEVSSEN